MSDAVVTDEPASPLTGRSDRDGDVHRTAIDLDDDGAPPPDPVPPHRSLPWAGLGAVILAVAVLVPIAVAGVNGMTRTWYPAGDWAMLEMRVLDVGTLDTPLVGPYSRYSWNHPGPLLAWLSAVPYRLTGGDPSALLLGAALINTVAVGGMLWFAWRRGRLALLAPMAFALALLTHTLGPLLLRNPWNAWVIVLPLGLLVMAAWAAIEGDRLGWPVVAGVGAFLAQTHIGLLPFVAVATVAAVVAHGWPRRSWRALAPGLVVAAVCWSPVLVDLLFGARNLLDIAAHFRKDSHPAGFATGLGIAAREIGAPAPWLGGLEEVNAAGGGLKTSDLALAAIPVGLFVLTLIGAWWARAFAAVRLQLVIAATALIGVFAVSRITDEVFDYLVRWWWTVVAVGTAAMVWSAISVVRHLTDRITLAPPRHRRLRAAAQVAVLLVTLVLIGRPGLDTIEHIGASPLPVDDWYPAMHRITSPTLVAVPDDRPVLVRSAGPIAGWAADALAPRLVADGVDVRVDDDNINPYKYGLHRMAPTDRSTARGVWVATGYRIHDFRASGTGVEVVAFDPLTPNERIEYDALEQRLRVWYLASGRDDLARLLDDGQSLFSDRPVPDLIPEVQSRYEELRRRGVSVAVFLTARADIPAPPEHLP